MRPISNSEPVKPPCRSPAFELGDVLADLRPDIGVGRRGRGALELMPLAGQLGAGGDEHIGQQPAHFRRRGLLVVRREVGVEEADRQRFDARVPQFLGQRLELAAPSGVCTSPGPRLRSVISKRSSRGTSGGSRWKRRSNGRVRLPRPISSMSRKPLRGEQRGLGADALQQRVDDQRGAMLDEARLPRLELRLANAVEDRLAQAAIGGRAFGVGDRAGRDVAGDEVGEGAADIDGDDVSQNIFLSFRGR